MSEEKMELVTRFEDLRAGMLVVVKSCVQCARDHRGILVRLKSDASCTDPRDGRRINGPAWERLPQDCKGGWIYQHVVAERRCFSVIVEDPKSADTYRAEIRLLETAR